MNQVARTFILVGLVVVILFAMRFLPTIYLGDNELRQVNQRPVARNTFRDRQHRGA